MPVKNVKKIPTSKLKSLIKKARKEYYSGTGTSTKLSDAEFDTLEDELRRRLPNDSLLKSVGHLPKNRKVRLPFAMGSLDKIKPDGTAEEWLEGTDSVYIDDKLDGVSLLYHNHPINGYKLYTRGNSTVGQDVSHLIPYIKGMGRLPKGHAVRGELLISLGSFKSAFADAFKNPRNLVSGIVNSKPSNKSKQVAKKATFVVFGYVSPKSTIEKVKGLKSKGFITVWRALLKNPTEAKLAKALAKRKRESKYEVDGLVCTTTDSRYSIAFKDTTESLRTSVESIEWNVSRHGTLKPTIIIKPVNLSGVTITRATGNNAAWIKDRGIAKGALVEITRSGDVIPKVVRVIRKSTSSPMPKEGTWKWDENKTDIVFTGRGSSSTSSKILVNKITHFFAYLGIDGVKEASLSKLVAAGHTTIPAIYALDPSQIEEALGNKAASKSLIAFVKQPVSDYYPARFMAASGIFPRGWGETKFNNLFTRGIPYDKLLSFKSSKKLISAIAEVHGFTEAGGSQLAAHLLEYKKFARKMGYKPPKMGTSEGLPFYGKQFAFTGFRSKELQAAIESKGGTVGQTVNKDTAYLVVADLNSSSSKAKKARELGVKIIDFAAAEAMFQLSS